MRRKLVLSLSFLALLGSLASCKKEKDNPPPPSEPSARVAFSHTVLNGSEFKVTLNDEAIGGMENLNYGTHTGYHTIKPVGSKEVSYKFTATNTNLVSTSYNFEADKHYSVFATGMVTSPQLLITQDDLTAPGDGNAKIRFINLSADSQPQDSYVGTSKLLEGLEFAKASGFQAVKAGTYKLTMGDPTNLPSSVSLENVDLAAGKIYTCILMGGMNATGEAGTKLSIITNN